MERVVDEVMGSAYNEGNFSGVFAGGIRYLTLGAYPGRLEYVRLQHSIERAISAVPGGRIYHDDTDEADEFSITGLTVLWRGSPVTIAGAINQALSGGDVAHYIYADPSTAAWVVNTTGWPTTPHVRIAVITLVAGAWSWSNFVDHRAAQTIRVASDPIVGKAGILDITASRALLASESGLVITNAGATAEVDLDLPTTEAGLVYECLVRDADGLKLVAPAGSTIRNGGTVSGDGGYIRSSTIGSTLRLLAASSTDWVVMGVTGTWTVDS